MSLRLFIWDFCLPHQILTALALKVKLAQTIYEKETN